MNQNSSIGERLAILMRHYGLNKNSLTVKIGLTSNSILGRIVNDPTRSPSFELLKEIFIKFPAINGRWLVTGEGDMLGKELASFEKGEIRYFKLDAGEQFPEDFNNRKPTAVITIYGFRDCEFAIDVFGDSMVPRFKHGDMILCSNFLNKPIIFGEPYLIISNGKPIIRFIKNQIEKSAYKVSAENPRYEDYEINATDMSQLYLIKGIIRREVF